MKCVFPSAFPSFLIALILSLYSTSTIAGNLIIVLSNANDGIAEKLVQELDASGFNVEIMPDSGAPNLEAIAREKGASAAIRANLKGRRVQVWVADRITNKMVSRSIEVEPGEEPVVSIVVLAAVELLRASLMEIYAADAPTGESLPSRETKEFAKPAPPSADDSPIVQLLLAIGPGFSYIGRDTGMSANVSLLLGAQFMGKLQLGAVGYLPINGHKIEEPEGRVQILPFLVGGEIAATALPPGFRVRPIFGLGFGALLLHTRGSLAASGAPADGQRLEAHEGTAVSPLPWLRIAVIARMIRVLSVRMDFLGGFSLAENRLEIAGRGVASLGRPVIAVNFALELMLW